jgi:hypothetical protein
LKTCIKGYRSTVRGPVGENVEWRAEKYLPVFENCELKSRNVFEYEGSVVDGVVVIAGGEGNEIIFRRSNDG